MLPRKSYTLRLPGRDALNLGDRTLVMGIINVTPDSFADGGVHLDSERALDTALAFEAEGVDIVDIGGESTRPGAIPLSVSDEIARVLPVLQRLAPRLRVPISIDTYKSEVAYQAIDNGATLINDISALRYDSNLATVTAKSGVPIVLMHTRGRSREMYQEANYTDVAGEIVQELTDAINRAVKAGISCDQLIIDPGLGFAKQASHTFEMLARLDELAKLDRPIMVGPSRKSFLQEVLGECPPSQREWGTAAAVAAAVLLGAHIVRVHGVREMLQIVRIADRLRESKSVVNQTSSSAVVPSINETHN